MINAGYFGYKYWKAIKDKDEEEGEEEGDEEGEEEEEEDVEEEEKEEELGKDGEEQEGEDADLLLAGAQVNESDVDLLEFLNDANTPGLDDSPDMKVNPVLMYVIEREKKLEKARAEAEAAAEGDGEGAAKETSAAANDGPKKDFKVSATKRLGWSLSKDAVVAADTTKQLKNVEAYLSKSLDIDVKKTAIVRATKAGEKTHNALEVARMASIHARDKNTTNVKHEKAAQAAEVARAQLRMMKLKTRVEVEEEAAPEKAEGDGEEGEEGAKEEGEE